MFDGVGVVVAAMNTVTLVCGGFVTMLSFRAYRRTNAPSLRALAIGIGFVTVGALVAGGLHLIGNVELAMGIIVKSSFNALGFAILGYSLFTTGATPP